MNSSLTTFAATALVLFLLGHSIAQAVKADETAAVPNVTTHATAQRGADALASSVKTPWLKQ